MKKYIYFDHAATTPVAQEVFAAMKPYFRTKYGNPSSAHFFGQEAKEAVEKARQKAAGFLGADPSEIIFTSGATESDNLAILGLAKTQKGRSGHLITTAIEHPAVSEPCQFLEKEGYALTRLPVGLNGIISAAGLEKEIRADTFLVSVMFVNNEIGAVQPVEEIGRLIKELNQKRKQKIYFHIDAVQAANYFDCGAERLKADLISLSAHKIYGPKGVGLLYLRKGTLLQPIQFGGHQERGLRPGTINAPLIVGLGEALQAAKEKRSSESGKAAFLTGRIIDFCLKNIPDCELNGDREKRSPGHVNLSFHNVEGESLLLMLEGSGIIVSTGSACASHSLAPSPVLKALGLSDEKCHGSIRITLGRDNTEKEVDYFLKVLPEIIKKLRDRSPLK